MPSQQRFSDVRVHERFLGFLEITTRWGSVVHYWPYFWYCAYLSGLILNESTQLEEVKDQLDKLKTKTFIKLSTSLSSAPVVLNGKKNGGKMLCID